MFIVDTTSKRLDFMLVKYVAQVTSVHKLCYSVHVESKSNIVAFEV